MYEVDYSWLITEDKPLSQYCHNTRLLSDYVKKEEVIFSHFKAFKKSKICLDKVCFFDLIPESILRSYLDLKNEVTLDVWENNIFDENYYNTLKRAHTLCSSMESYSVNLDKPWLRENKHKYNTNKFNNKHIKYDIFKTKTGRLSTKKDSFPILNMNTLLRRALLPNSDLFVSFDYNAAEVRTMLALMGIEQPKSDIHSTHSKVLKTDRKEAKSTFFSWLYDPVKKHKYFDSTYDRGKLLDKYYYNGCVETDFGRSMPVEKDKAFNYILQSTANDIAIENFYKVQQHLVGKKTKIAFMIHDSLVLDVSKEESSDLLQIKNLIEETRYGTINCSLSVGKNLLDMREVA